jgi:alpha-tubulin suppressor-like RCC1 family protein
VGTFLSISAGGHHQCGLKSDTTIACWGMNQNGEATPPAK